MAGSSTIKDSHCLQRSKEHLWCKVQAANHVWKNPIALYNNPTNAFSSVGDLVGRVHKKFGGERLSNVGKPCFIINT